MGGRATACLRGVTRGGPSARGLDQAVRIGISGWTYVPWRGVFYPKGLPRKRELEYAAQKLRSGEAMTGCQVTAAAAAALSYDRHLTYNCTR
jgi:hypothetical protein